MKQIIDLITKYVIGNVTTIVVGIFKILADVFRIYIRPFWFSGTKNTIVAPYVYVFFGVLLFFGAVALFFNLTYLAAVKGINNPEVVLPTLAGVIATLTAQITLMISVYNKGKNGKKDNNDKNENI
jgi:hypothetical protein